MRRRSTALGVLLAASLTSCGSTVAMTSTSQGVAEGPAEFSATGGAAARASGGALPAPGTPHMPSTAHAPSAASAPGVIAGPGAEATTVARDTKPVQVGVAYTTNVDSFGAAFGGSFDTGDQRVQAEAVVNYLNRHGGLGGHRIVPVWFPVDLTDSRPYEETAQIICATWTQDNHVVAGLFVAANVPFSLARCLSSKQVLYVNSGFYPHDGQDFRTAPYMVNPDELAVDAGARTYVDGLVAAGFLSKGDRIGLMRYDIAAVRRATETQLKPALARHGLDLKVEFEVHFPDSTAGIANSAAPVQSAVLQMRNENVNKVLMLCAGCAMFFMQAADSQAYRPEYGLSSMDRPFLLPPQVPATQLAGAVGIGWLPLNDVPMDQAPPRSASGRLCDSILRPTGEATRQGPRFVGSSYCEALLLMAAAARKAVTVTGRGLRDAAMQLGSYSSVNALSARLTPDRRDGVASYRVFRFTPGCTCFLYGGQEHPAR